MKRRMKEIKSMKPEPQNAAPVNSETEGSHLEPDAQDAGEGENQPANTGGEREGWRAYFPAAVRKISQRRDDEERAGGTFARLQARFGITLMVLIFALFCFAASARANTYIVSTAADNGSDANPTFGSLRKAIRDANAVPGADTIIFQIPGGGLHTITPRAQLPDILH
jgi:hypothetical protein